VFGRQELEELGREKAALITESGLNRAVVQAELQNLGSTFGWVSGATRTSREFAPFLLLLAPLAGFLLARGSRRPASWVKRVVAGLKWLGPLYKLWKSFSSARHPAEDAESAS
jgi:hypothetical protein